MGWELPKRFEERRHLMEDQIKILFFGSCVAEEDLSYIISNERGQVQFAAQKVCWFFIKGVEACLTACDLLLSLRVSSYPVFQKVFVFNLKHRQCANGRTITYVPYVNLPGIRYISTVIMALFHLSRWLWQTKNSSERCIIVYAMYQPHIIATWLVSQLTGIKTIMIVPDLPEYMNFASRGKLNSWLREVNVRVAHWIAAGFDGLVFFSKNMAEKIDCRKLRWIVIEGCVEVTPDKSAVSFTPTCETKAIMYSGNLNRVYGVGNLIEAVRQIINPELELWLCGSGEMVAEIKQYAEQDSRIKYFGSLPNQEVLSMQQRAMLLVNPRNNDQEFTRYSFPSKNLEYMSSGRPVILCRMDGIPEEYYDYVLLADNGTAEAIRIAIVTAMNRSAEELNCLGETARTFVNKNKNYISQCEKIRDMLENIFEKETGANYINF
jgi:glycosyltransferase involved in cell wall biosynthesis